MNDETFACGLSSLPVVKGGEKRETKQPQGGFHAISVPEHLGWPMPKPHMS
jgi:hypothetical protein